MIISKEHAKVMSTFIKKFVSLCGNADAFEFTGDYTSNGTEPDWSCGPQNPTIPLPTGLDHVCDWRTFSLEVEYSQSQGKMDKKAKN